MSFEVFQNKTVRHMILRVFLYLAGQAADVLLDSPVTQRAAKGITHNECLTNTLYEVLFITTEYGSCAG
jgi:hypothetical protein